MDLLENVAQELEFDFHLYVVSDGAFGTRTRTENGTEWNGIVGDLVSGAAHMAFAAFSVSSARSEVIDYSVPYFFSGVSFLAAPTQKSEVPLLAFLLPFSPELWIAIFTSLNITAMAVAVYEWLSPFGLNPWGRQRSKNFSIASALWVMWGLLCGHLVAFKAPKSWPNKFLINVWGGFSVIFVASYTANIAALIAGLFFHNAVGNYHDRSVSIYRLGGPVFDSVARPTLYPLFVFTGIGVAKPESGSPQSLGGGLLRAQGQQTSVGAHAEIHGTGRRGGHPTSQVSASLPAELCDSVGPTQALILDCRPDTSPYTGLSAHHNPL
uniref:Ionotropic glutamate receptor C-terminal domain-containing protein n=1 Tax=Timema shepardi TaxID=629360 RepID=A0A7R9G8S8_TIMSH|nr:unnamed protein product [Timema shepardi]